MVYMKSGNIFYIEYPFEKFEELYYNFPIYNLLEEKEEIKGA